MFLIVVGTIMSIILFIENQSESDKKNSDINWAETITGHDTRSHSNPVKIAILDSGVNQNHEALKKVKVKEYNAFSKKEETVSDEFGHGTAIAGLITGQSKEFRGVLTDAILYDVKVLNEAGEGKLENVIAGIEWSIEKEVDIINISFGFSKNYEALHKAIDSALKNNIVVVAAAGNNMGLSVDYPANYENVISIGSIDKSLKIDESSTTTGADYFAPGVDVISTSNDGGYKTYTGSSFATAYATGIFASIMSNNSIQHTKLSSSSLKPYIIHADMKDNENAKILTLNKKVLEESK